MKEKNEFLLVGMIGALGVVLGAFGAHFLKNNLTESSLAIYKTGVQYHFYHSLAMLGVMALGNRIKARNRKFSIIFFAVGILCFSGSLYVLATASLIGWNPSLIAGPLTPIGGLFFIVGWMLLAFGYVESH